MEPQPIRVRGTVGGGSYLVLDDPAPLNSFFEVAIRFIAVPLTPEQSWDDLTPEQLAELEARLAATPFLTLPNDSTGTA